MSLTNYSDLQTALTNWLRHSLFSAQYGDMVTLFEATANRRLRTREMETVAILVPSIPPIVAVTNAANNGSGLIRLTLAANSANYATGQELEVTGVQGTLEANGAWIVTVINSTTVDLQNSTFTNAYAGGGQVQAEPGFAALPSDYLAWRRATWTGTISTFANVTGSAAGNRRELRYVEPSYFQAAFPSRPTDIPAFFTVEGSNLKITPVNQAPIEFLYYAKIPGLVANSTNWLMTTHPDLYLFGSLCEAELFGLNDERMPMWKGRRDELFEEIAMQRRFSQASPGAEIMVMGVTP